MDLLHLEIMEIWNGADNCQISKPDKDYNVVKVCVNLNIQCDNGV